MTRPESPDAAALEPTAILSRGEYTAEQDNAAPVHSRQPRRRIGWKAALAGLALTSACAANAATLDDVHESSSRVQVTEPQVVLSPIETAEETLPEHPNIIVVNADDMRFDDMCHIPHMRQDF